MLPEVCNFGFSSSFTPNKSICFGSRDMLRSCLETKEAIPRPRDKAAKKKTAFGLNFDLYQCQVRRGDFLISRYVSWAAFRIYHPARHRGATIVYPFVITFAFLLFPCLPAGRFPVLLSIDFDLNSFFFEAGV